MPFEALSRTFTVAFQRLMRHPAGHGCFLGSATSMCPATNHLLLPHLLLPHLLLPHLLPTLPLLSISLLPQELDYDYLSRVFQASIAASTPGGSGNTKGCAGPVLRPGAGCPCRGQKLHVVMCTQQGLDTSCNALTNTLTSTFLSNWNRTSGCLVGCCHARGHLQPRLPLAQFVKASPLKPSPCQLHNHPLAAALACSAVEASSASRSTVEPATDVLQLKVCEGSTTAQRGPH